MSNKVVVVTGTARRGIGKGVATRFTQSGDFTVLTADILEEKGAQVAGEIGARFHSFDITVSESVRSLAEAAESLGEIHAVFNFAGFPVYEERHGLLAQEPEKMLETIRRNVLGPQLLAKYFLARMLGSQDSPRLFVQGSSVNGFRHYGQAGYSSAEASQVGFGVGATYDFGKRWVTYVPIIMGSIDTPATANEKRDFAQAIPSSVPMGNAVATPEEIGEILYSLATIPAFRLIHSRPLFVDGGQSLCEPGELIQNMEVPT